VSFQFTCVQISYDGLNSDFDFIKYKNEGYETDSGEKPALMLLQMSSAPLLLQEAAETALRGEEAARSGGQGS
jgi:hypothetical protein